MNNHSYFIRRRLLMKNKVVIVTGGSSGMGKAMVQRFANEGAYVVMTGRNEERLTEAKSEIEKKLKNKKSNIKKNAKYPIQLLVMALRNLKKVDHMVREKEEYFRKHDHLFNNLLVFLFTLQKH